MGQVRSAIRAYAVSGLSPTEVLSSLDRLFDTLIEDRVVTAVVGTITPSTGRVVLSNAGHPPPLVVRADGSATFCPMERTLLIAAGLSGAPRPRDEVVLDRGDSLIMYSDGLIERRGEVITDGMERLANTATVVARAGWPDHPAVTFASMLSVEERTDDIVVLCLNYTGVSEERISAPAVGTTRDGMSTLHLEPVVESTPVARHWVAAHLRDLPAEVTGCAALLDLRAGHQRSAARRDPVVRDAPHPAGPHPGGRRRRQPLFPVHQGVRQGRGHRSGPDAVQYLGVELGSAGGRRRQDRVVRAPGRVPGRSDECLRRQLSAST